jgi:hypothetical protein
MRVADLSPRWVGGSLGGWAGTMTCGLTFRCPHCERRIGVLFRPFIDPHGIAASYPAWAIPGAPSPNTGKVPDTKWWTRASGETFNDLTLTPSVNVEGHWHGFITNGECR